MSEKTKGRFEKSVDTSIIEKRLRDTPEGETVAYSELSKLLGRDVREFCYGNLTTARRTLVDESIFFDVVDGIGYKRLSNEESVKSPQSYLKRATNAAKQAVRHLRNIKFDELSDNGKKSHLVASAVGGAMMMFGSSKANKRIESKVAAENKELPIGETLKLFGG